MMIIMMLVIVHTCERERESERGGVKPIKWTLIDI